MALLSFKTLPQIAHLTSLLALFEDDLSSSIINFPTLALQDVEELGPTRGAIQERFAMTVLLPKNVHRKIEATIFYEPGSAVLAEVSLRSADNGVLVSWLGCFSLLDLLYLLEHFLQELSYLRHTDQIKLIQTNN